MTKDDLRKLISNYLGSADPDDIEQHMPLACQVANAILDELESHNEEVEIDSEEGGYVGRAVCLRHFGLLRMEICRDDKEKKS